MSRWPLAAILLIAACTSTPSSSSPSPTAATVESPSFDTLPAVGTSTTEVASTSTSVAPSANTASAPTTEAPPTSRPPLTTTPRPTTTFRTEPLADARGMVPFGTPVVFTYTGLPLDDGALSQQGDRLAFARNSELCLLDLTVRDATGPDPQTPTCVDGGGQVNGESINWAHDGSTVLFSHEPFFAESDVMAFDVDDAAPERLTDDGIDDPNSEFAVIDTAPLHGPAGQRYHLRLDRSGDSPTTLLAEIDNGLSTPLARIATPATSAEIDPASGTIAIEVPGVGRGVTLVVVDLAAQQISEISAPGDRGFIGVHALRGGRVLASVRRPGAANVRDAAIVDLASGGIDIALAPIFTNQQRPTGFALAPDGRSVIMIVEDRSDADSHLLLWAPILDDGTVDEWGIVAEGADFAPNDGDKTIRPRGLDNAGQVGLIGWLPDRLVYALGPDRVVVLPVIE